jgi:hypothetical protein
MKSFTATNQSIPYGFIPNTYLSYLVVYWHYDFILGVGGGTTPQSICVTVINMIIHISVNDCLSRASALGRGGQNFRAAM